MVRELITNISEQSRAEEPVEPDSRYLGSVSNSDSGVAIKLVLRIA